MSTDITSSNNDPDLNFEALNREGKGFDLGQNTEIGATEKTEAIGDISHNIIAYRNFAIGGASSGNSEPTTRIAA